MYEFVKMAQRRLNIANGQWIKLVKMYEDISNEERYILFTKPKLLIKAKTKS
jgi:hypothetical protein